MPLAALALNKLILDNGYERYANISISSLQTSKSTTCDDLIYDLQAHAKIAKVAHDYFKEVGEKAATMGALQLACRYNWGKVVEGLLEMGVSVNVVRAVTGDSPLILAAT